MGRKQFCVPALVASFIATVLLLLCTISSPTTFSSSTPFNFVTASDLGNITDLTPGANRDRQLSGIKLGSWGYCTQGALSGEYDYCSDNNHGYNVTLAPANTTQQAAYTETMIESSYTRGLVIVVVAFVVSIVALALSVVPHLIVMLVASALHLIAFLLALIAFIVQIVLFIYTRARVNDVSNTASVMPGPGFYLTLISIPLLLFSAITVCCGYRSQKRKDQYPAYEAESSKSGGRFAGLTSKFRRNRNRDTAATGSDDASSYQPSRNTGAEKIPMQSSRQRVLDAFNQDSNTTKV